MMIAGKEKDIVYEVVGCAMRVHNNIGHGFREKTYENALCVELNSQDIPYEQQREFEIEYRETVVDKFVPDLIVNDELIVEIKTAESIIDEHKGQVLNYLRVTGLRLGAILNFKHPKLQWERLILDTAK